MSYHQDFEESTHALQTEVPEAVEAVGTLLLAVRDVSLGLSDFEGERRPLVRNN